jgi:hypothetical protein
MDATMTAKEVVAHASKRSVTSADSWRTLQAA